MDIKIIRGRVQLREYDLSEHAHSERQEEQITTEEIEQTIFKGSIIEKYPKDKRGPSYLVASKKLHIICGFRGERLLIITVYRPKKPIWIDFKTRAKELKDRE